MMFRDAMRSLRMNFSRAFFYWLTFVLTSMFIFIFFNIAMSDEIGVSFINSANDLSLNVTVFVIGVCMVIIFFANDFYVKNKSRDLAVRLVCGATYSQLAGYLLTQTFLLLILSIAAGLVLGMFMIPVLNVFLPMWFPNAFTVGIHVRAIIATAVILVLIAFWTTYLNMAFAYRNSASMLLNDTKIRINFDMPKLSVGNFTIPPIVKQLFWLALFAIPMFMFYRAAEGALLWSLIGLIGYNGFMKSTVLPFMNRLIDHSRIHDPISLAALGFARSDLQMMRLNMILLILSSILLSAIMLGNGAGEMEMMLSMLSYIVMNVLLSMAIMFKYSTELSLRTGYFRTLDQIGYTHGDQKKIVFREVTLFYGFTLAVILLYLSNMYFAMVHQGSLTTGKALSLICMLVIPMVLCWIITLYYYSSAVLKTKTDK